MLTDGILVFVGRHQFIRRAAEQGDRLAGGGGGAASTGEGNEEWRGWTSRPCPGGCPGRGSGDRARGTPCARTGFGSASRRPAAQIRRRRNGRSASAARRDWPCGSHLRNPK